MFSKWSVIIRQQQKKTKEYKTYIGSWGDLGNEQTSCFGQIFPTFCKSNFYRVEVLHFEWILVAFYVNLEWMTANIIYSKIYLFADYTMKDVVDDSVEREEWLK